MTTRTLTTAERAAYSVSAIKITTAIVAGTLKHTVAVFENAKIDDKQTATLVRRVNLTPINQDVYLALHSVTRSIRF